MTTRALPPLSPRHPTLVYESDPEFGDYVYSETIESWSNRRVKANGQEFSLLGRGRRPSQAQRILWRSLEEAIEWLSAAAVEAVRAPPVSVEQTTVGELKMRQIRLELNGSVNVIVGSEAIDQSTGLALMVTFVNEKVSESRWII